MESKAQNRVYVTMMVDSLKKKEKVLRSLLEMTEKQSALLKEEQLDADLFSTLIDQKGKEIEELDSLNDGFDRLFHSIKEELERNREDYREEIQTMQRLIAVVSELSVSVQAVESQNNERFKKFLAREKDAIKNFYVNNRTASSYYQNMANVHREDKSYFFNEKK